MPVNLFIFFAGLFLLYIGADRLVAGAVGIASRYKVPSLVIGLTVVAFGTSTPEFVVSITAAFQQINDIALGNVIGSNIVNIALIIGLAAIIKPLQIHLRSIIAETPIMIGSMILLLILSMNQSISRVDGAILITALLLFLVFSYRTERTESQQVSKQGQKEFIQVKLSSTGRSIVFVIIGIIALTIGAHFLVNSSITIAERIGLSEKFIGLTIVAIGTSLPELATSVMAAFRGESDISVGNIIGSNIFNVLGILGVTSVLHPIAIEGGLTASGYLWDYALVIILSISVWMLMITGRTITRGEGIGLVILYITYLFWLYYRG